MKLAHFLVVLGLAACASPEMSDLSMQFRETPLRLLPGVELGITGKRLHALRPQAKYTPYLGLQEKLPGYLVSYQFSSAMDDAPKDIDPNDTLEGIYITQMFDSMDAADSTWRSQVKAITAGHRKPDICESVPPKGMQARWFSGKMVMAVGVFPKEPAAPGIVDRVLYAIAPATLVKQPAGATQMACPTT